MENNKRLIIADVKSPNYKGQSIGHFFTVAQNYYDLFYYKIKTLIAGGPVYGIRFNKVHPGLKYLLYVLQHYPRMWLKSKLQ